MAEKRKPGRAGDVSDADSQLFRDAVGPLRRTPPVAPPPRQPPPPPRAHMSQRDEAQVRKDMLRAFDPSNMVTGAELAWLRAGHSPRLLRRLRRGHYSIGGELDLHHTTANAARELLHDFIDDAVAAEVGCVRVIHGKGLRSGPRGPVLKALTDHVLRHRREVIAFTSAPAAEGGTGAVLVLLKTR